ncbi:MAG: hypothetical protein Q8O22_03915, partial [Candidatus Omnitrophota bacterium]|nr:hypothetical protein [Candidatus Omnitrophota bacterium]
MKKQNSIYIALVIILLASVACNIGGSALAPSDTPAPTDTSAPADPLSSPLIGKWETTTETVGVVTIVFTSDGGYEVSHSGTTFVLTYVMVDADTFL